MLKQHAQAAAQVALQSDIRLVQIDPEQADGATIRPQQAQYLAQQGCLAAPRTAEQADDLPGPHLQG